MYKSSPALALYMCMLILISVCVYVYTDMCICVYPHNDRSPEGGISVCTEGYIPVHRGVYRCAQRGISVCKPFTKALYLLADIEVSRPKVFKALKALTIADAALASGGGSSRPIREISYQYTHTHTTRDISTYRLRTYSRAHTRIRERDGYSLRGYRIPQPISSGGHLERLGDNTYLRLGAESRYQYKYEHTHKYTHTHIAPLPPSRFFCGSLPYRPHARVAQVCLVSFSHILTFRPLVGLSPNYLTKEAMV